MPKNLEKMMKTTLLDRKQVSEKAIELLDKHPVYSSFFSSEKSIIEILSKLNLPNIEVSVFLNALTHRSFRNENGDWPFDNNERLEFVGDSVLELIISEKLVGQFPEMAEGSLSKLRSAVVNESFLAHWCQILDVGPYVLLGKGELKNGERVQDSILADTFEALLGAVYLNLGLEAAIHTLDCWIGLWEESQAEQFFSLKRLEEFDPKSRLQELTLAMNGELPLYQSSDKGDGSFEVKLVVGGTMLGIMTSTSKRKAEKALAYKALKNNLLENIKEV